MAYIKSLFKFLYKTEFEKYKQQIHSLEDELANKKRENQHLLENISNLQKTSDNDKKSLLSKDEEIKKLQQNENKLQHSIQIKIHCLESMTAELHELKVKEASFRRQSEELNKELSNANNAYASLTLLYNSTINDKSSIQNEYEALVKRNNEVEEENKALKESYGKLLSLMQDSQDRINKLENIVKEGDELSRDQKVLIEQLRRELAESMHKKQLLEIQIAELPTNVDLHNKNIALENKEREICSLKTEIIELKSKIQNLEEELKETIEKLTPLSQERSEVECQESEGSPFESSRLSNIRKENWTNNSESNSAPTEGKNNIVSPNVNPVRKTKVFDFDNARKNHEQSQRARRFILPYRHRSITPISEVVSKDFPPIENENSYYNTSRTISRVFNHRSNSLIEAGTIFLKKSAEEISRIRMDLEDAVRSGVPYLSCPCCGNLVKISAKSSGFGDNRREVQFFTHAVRNIACDLKRTSSTATIDYVEDNAKENEYIILLRNLLSDVLKMEVSKNKGVSQVNVNEYVNSEELPVMKRRLADATAKYNEIGLVFEFVKPTTNIAIFRDREIFYYLNKKQVFWIFGLESFQDYSELSRSVSKDILYRNRRNVFVFDLVAQIESERRGELILKCNWLDENDEWYFQINKNGANGILVSLDELKFDPEGCYPYYFDAEEYYYKLHSDIEAPLKQSRGDLKKEIIDSWNYEMLLKEAVNDMSTRGQSVQAYYDGSKWGFKYGDMVFIEPIFDDVTEFNGNYAKVKKNDKLGVVDRFGHIHLQPEYEQMELLPNGQILYATFDQWLLEDIIEPIARYYPGDSVNVSVVSEEKEIFKLIIFHQPVEKQSKTEELFFIDNDIIKKDDTTGKWFLWYAAGEKIKKVLWDAFDLTPELNMVIKRGSSTDYYDLSRNLLQSIQCQEEKSLDIEIIDSKVQTNNSCNILEIINQSEDSPLKNETLKHRNKNYKSQKNKKDKPKELKVGNIYIWKITHISRSKNGKIEYILLRDNQGRTLEIDGKSINDNLYLKASLFVDKRIKMKKVGSKNKDGITRWQWIID